MTGTRAIIHLENLRHNIAVVRNLVGPHRKICFPVKANGYGHGMVAVAKAGLEYGCNILSIARTEEAVELREAGITAPLLIMGHIPTDELNTIASLGVEPFAGSSDYIASIERAAAETGRTEPLGIHLKIDTGMGRIGCAVHDAPALAEQIFAAPHLKLAGLCTHFAVSDHSDSESVEYTQNQLAQLKEVAAQFRSLEGFSANGEFLLHGANSGGVSQHPESYLDMVRPGIMLYGYEPLTHKPVGVKPLMELSSELTFIKKINPGDSVSYGRTWRAEKKTWVGTLPIGYGDGYSRHLSNRGRVWIDGQFYPVVGRVCMDQIMVDLGIERDWSGCEGTEVTLFGPKPSHHSAADIARELGTISYEVCCLITGRVPRIYTEEKSC